MNNISTVSELKEAILLLEYKQGNDRQLLKQQFEITYESLKPINLIKNTISDLTTVPDLKNDVINSTLSIAAGYLAKKVVVGKINNSLSQLLGTILQIGVTSIVSKNSDGIKNTLMKLVSTVLSKKE